jgi:hypothetical protein
LQHVQGHLFGFCMVHEKSVKGMHQACWPKCAYHLVVNSLITLLKSQKQ